MLLAFDYLLSFFHIGIILFNLVGWIFEPTRQVHLVVVLATALFWFIVGIWKGFGYCPVTDYQWRVKARLGVTDLPDSYIKYALDKASGLSLDPALVNQITLVGFFGALLISLYLNVVR